MWINISVSIKLNFLAATNAAFIGVTNTVAWCTCWQCLWMKDKRKVLQRKIRRKVWSWRSCSHVNLKMHVERWGMWVHWPTQNCFAMLHCTVTVYGEGGYLRGSCDQGFVVALTHSEKWKCKLEAKQSFHTLLHRNHFSSKSMNYALGKWWNC